MSIQDLGALGELLGSLAVLVTLVYLALQTRQNSTAIAAQLDASLMIARHTSLLSASESTGLAEALQAQRVEPRSIEQDRVYRYWAAEILRMQWAWEHGRKGLLLSYDETRLGEVVAQHFRNFRDFGEWWDGGLRWNQEFVKWVEEQRAKGTAA